MVQGTTSDAGKSMLVAAFCRLLANRQKRVLPFKPQNMALNSAVTSDGGEIGRAQALQAQACKVAPTVHMNPVLIKPSSDTGAQIIIHGKPFVDMNAWAFHEYKPQAMKAVLHSYEKLKSLTDVILVEGAGSPAEINLREGDIANMGFAQAVDCPVVIIADIDKGGVFAHLVGTLALLSASEQDRVIGFFINKFRGDIALLQPGLDWLEQKTKKPVLAVIPYVHDLYLDAEDAINTAQAMQENTENKLTVCVLVLPRMSNHTDFDALRLHAHVDLKYIKISDDLPPCDLIILPGSKNVRADFQHLKTNKWKQKIHRHLRYGGKLMGICGGYQMLGESIHDPLGIEGKPGSIEGFHFFPMKTSLQKEKTLTKVSGFLTINRGSSTFEGYEIHCGTTVFKTAIKRSVAKVTNTKSNYTDGYINNDNNIMGTYIHGLLDKKSACDAILKWCGLVFESAIDVNDMREAQLDRIAEVLDDALDEKKFNRAMNVFNERAIQQ